MARRQRNINPWDMGGLLAILAAGCLGISSLLHMTNVPPAYAAAQTSAQPIHSAMTESDPHAGVKLFPLSIPTQSPSLPAERAAWTSLPTSLALPAPPAKTVEVKAPETKV